MTNSFKAKTKDAESWKQAISAVSALVDEAVFSADKDGISFRGLDAAHIAMIDLFWPSNGFESYECDSAVKFGVRVDEFSKLLKRADKKDSVEISLGKNELNVKFEGTYSKQYKTHLVDISSSEQKLPKLNFNAKVVMPVSLFNKAISDVQVVSDSLELQANTKLTISGKDDSRGEANIVLGIEDGLEEINAKEESKAIYSLDYLSNIVKALASTGESVTIQYSTKMPCMLTFSLAQAGKISYFLAPRVE